MNKIPTFIDQLLFKCPELAQEINHFAEYVAEYYPVELICDRDPKWERLRSDWIIWQPNCQVCGTNHNCEVHHIYPVHIFPALELDKNNLITLCRRDHLIFGHLFDWKSYNPHVIEDAKIWRTKKLYRPQV